MMGATAQEVPMLAMFRRHPLLIAAFALAMAAMLFFAVTFTRNFIYWQNHRQEPVSAWMTIGYVGHSWGVPPREIDRIANLPGPDPRPLTIREIAEAQGVPPEQVIARVNAAVAQLQAERHPPQQGPAR
ncbi:MAG: hypothetical protein Q4G14_10935 [Paracoccus sp. (in: a-proteobacteria)]|uniref:hypothetical protein n=1 Tax=Paracoccus sp. TaxID=267 RepID=UPI0026E09D9E|nr:hypothetical protein [Paracoccus sp. (in: a-proteobacteria)]MDO5613738.1 hypothetical protein [Paracoccus sp. (in: a-proteobacteria)]